ncbi:hypothetical protein EON65_19685 [archaeon]|nr:MAG: hypothetical protein EON65_19685 [archaeon]
MPISYYDQFIGNDWARYSKIMGKVATLSCFAFGLIDLILGISTLAALWTILAGFVLAIWEIPFIFILFPRFKEFQTYLLENCYVKFEETKAAVCLFLGLFCFTHFGFTTLAGIVLLMTAVAFACAAVNRRADEAAGLRRDSTPFEYPEDMKWGGGGVDQPQTTQSLLSAASKFGTF